MNQEHEPNTYLEITSLKLVLSILGLIAVLFSVWMFIANRNVPDPTPTEADAIAQLDEQARAEEEAQEQARLDRVRDEYEKLREEEIKAEGRMRAEATAEREQAIGQRNSLLTSIDELLDRRSNFEYRLEELLTSDAGRKISPSDKLMREYKEVAELGIRPDRRDIITLKEAVPKEHKYYQDDLPYYAPSTEDLERIRELSSSLDNFRGMLVQDEITLDEIIEAANANDPALTIKEAMVNWQARETLRLDTLKDAISAQNQIITPGANFAGFWTDQRDRPHYFRILIKQRLKNTFRGVIGMGRLDNPMAVSPQRSDLKWIEGILKEDKMILRSYNFERIRDDLKYGQAIARLKGIITGKVISGAVEEFDAASSIKLSNSGGHFYMQLMGREDPFDLVHNPADLLAPGAIWEGYATPIRPTAGKQFFVQLNISMRTSKTFSGVMQPGDKPIIDGALGTDGQVSWKIKEKNGQTTDFQLKMAEDTIQGPAKTIASGLRALHKVELDFKKIDLGFWRPEKR